ncbi:MAG: universal stress protein [Anaerolineae bacterium]|jgi:nucleotide-binding universal stress UspA family protein
MFEHILVPLDGSDLAESALPAAAYLADALDARATLIHVIEEDAPQEIHGQRHLSDPGEAQDYLAETAEGAFPLGASVDWHVHSAKVRDVAQGIAGHVDELGPDLIVMCTHGSGGVRGWLLGSIAQQVIGLKKAPVLLVQPVVAGAAPPFECRRMLVPLDGHPQHEQGLALAAGLVEPCQAEMRLLCVVPTRGTLKSERAASARLLPGASIALLEFDQEAASAYLERLVEELEGQGLWAATEVRRGDAASVIVQAARDSESDVIVLGTHGKAGMEAFWSESVAAQVCNQAELPLLLVPVESPTGEA